MKWALKQDQAHTEAAKGICLPASFRLCVGRTGTRRREALRGWEAGPWGRLPPPRQSPRPFHGPAAHGDTLLSVRPRTQRGLTAPFSQHSQIRSLAVARGLTPGDARSGPETFSRQHARTTQRPTPGLLGEPCSQETHCSPPRTASPRLEAPCFKRFGLPVLIWKPPASSVLMVD